MQHEVSDQILISRILGGEQQCFRMLVERYQDMAYTVALRLTKNNHLAEEVAQESFINAFRQLAAFRGEARFSTWLYTIVYRNAIYHLRKRDLRREEPEMPTQLPTSDPDPAQQMESQQKRALIERAINQLPKLEAVVITLYYLDEQSIKEIAEVMNLTESNIKVKLYRARKKLKKSLGQFQ